VTRPDAAWQHRAPDVDAEDCMFDSSHEYVHRNVLGSSRNVSIRKRINGTTKFCLFCLGVYLLTQIIELIRHHYH
jgi:hypothetical protein